MSLPDRILHILRHGAKDRAVLEAQLTEHGYEPKQIARGLGRLLDEGKIIEHGRTAFALDNQKRKPGFAPNPQIQELMDREDIAYSTAAMRVKRMKVSP